MNLPRSNGGAGAGVGRSGGEELTGGPYDLSVPANVRYKQRGYRIITTPS